MLGLRTNPLIGPVLATMEFVGECTLIFVDAMRRLGRKPFEFGETITQMAFIGVASVPIVLLTCFFSGAVLSLYLSEFLLRYGATAFAGATVGLAITREIGPVIAGVMVTARCGSAMAAQIGTMSVTEQIDALRMLSVHPSKYLVLPRLLAAATMVPVLALIGMWAGVVGGWLVSVAVGIPSGTFVNSVQQFVSTSDIVRGMAKGPFFGVIIALVACQQGLRTKDGAVGVGRATTNSVVLGIVLVYAANFVLAQILFAH